MNRIGRRTVMCMLLILTLALIWNLLRISLREGAV
jgi:hypothetical protein